MPGLVYIIVALIIVVFILSIMRASKTQALDEAWQRLASTHNLTYIPNYGSEQSYVIGEYRGYPLRLSVFDDALSSLSITRIMLKSERSSVNVVTHRDLAEQLGAVNFNIKGQIKTQIQEKGNQLFYYEQSGLESDTVYIQQIFDLLITLAQLYSATVAIGGQAVQALQAVNLHDKPGLHPIISQLLEDIGRSTTSMFQAQARSLLCLDCLVRFVPIPLSQSWLKTNSTYFGCRSCGQSRSIIKFAGASIAALDESMPKVYVQKKDGLFIKWSQQDALFDFDEVRILQATDEDVERFAVQVGNDTDPVQKARYQHMRCVVSSACPLSENTRRVLHRMFGTVEMWEEDQVS